MFTPLHPWGGVEVGGQVPKYFSRNCTNVQICKKSHVCHSHLMGVDINFQKTFLFARSWMKFLDQHRFHACQPSILRHCYFWKMTPNTNDSSVQICTFQWIPSQKMFLKLTPTPLGGGCQTWLFCADLHISFNSSPTPWDGGFECNFLYRSGYFI